MSLYHFIPIPLFAIISYSILFAGTAIDEAAIAVPFARYSGIYLVALAISYVMIMFLASHAEKLGFIDHPDGKRKIHTVAKPLVGGVGIVTGVLVAMLLFMPVMQNLGLVVAMLMIGTIGAIDDRRDVCFKIRFLVQTGATASIMFFGGTVLHSFGNLFGFGAIETGILAWPITLFCVVGVINAVNMTDGLDGLAGGTSLVAFSAFGMLAWLNNQPELTYISIAFVGALAAFLRFNWYPSKLFMGDVGSMSLGFVLAFFAIEVTQKTGGIVSPAAALLVLALPVTDTITVMVKRVMNGKSPFHPDKTHLHHIIKAMGFSHRKVVVLIISLTIISSSIAVIGTLANVPDYVLFMVYLFCFMAYYAASYRLRTIYRYLVRLRQQRVFNIELRKVLR